MTPEKISACFARGEKLLSLTQQEAELVMDSFKVSNQLTRDLALKVMGLVLEWASADAQGAVHKSLRAETDAEWSKRLLAKVEEDRR